MARSIRPSEAAEQAQALLEQSLALLDMAQLHRVAAHIDLARQLLDEWRCEQEDIKKSDEDYESGQHTGR